MSLFKTNGRFGGKKFAASMALTLGTGVIGAFFAIYAPGVYASLALPPFALPVQAYALIWIALYLLMGLAFYRILMLDKEAKGVKEARSAYYMLLFFNLFWSILFFGFGLRFAAFADSLVLLIYSILTVPRFRGLDKAAGNLMIPNALWVAFASILNLAIAILNR